MPVKVLQLGIMIHSLVIGMTLSITSGPDFSASLSILLLFICQNDDCTATLLIAVIFHQLFEGLSLGIRIASLPPLREFKHLRMLKPTLACLFAVTTPAGVLLGILIFAHNNDTGTISSPHLRNGLTHLTHSALASHSRNHVRHLCGHAHIRCLRRDARWRFRDGSDHVAEQCRETGTCTLQSGSWRHRYGAGGILGLRWTFGLSFFV